MASATISNPVVYGDPMRLFTQLTNIYRRANGFFLNEWRAVDTVSVLATGLFTDMIHASIGNDLEEPLLSMRKVINENGEANDTEVSTEFLSIIQSIELEYKPKELYHIAFDGAGPAAEAQWSLQENEANSEGSFTRAEIMAGMPTLDITYQALREDIAKNSITPFVLISDAQVPESGLTKVLQIMQTQYPGRTHLLIVSPNDALYALQAILLTELPILLRVGEQTYAPNALRSYLRVNWRHNLAPHDLVLITQLFATKVLPLPAEPLNLEVVLRAHTDNLVESTGIHWLHFRDFINRITTNYQQLISADPMTYREEYYGNLSTNIVRAMVKDYIQGLAWSIAPVINHRWSYNHDIAPLLPDLVQYGERAAPVLSDEPLFTVLWLWLVLPDTNLLPSLWRPLTPSRDLATLQAQLDNVIPSRYLSKKEGMVFTQQGPTYRAALPVNPVPVVENTRGRGRGGYNERGRGNYQRGRGRGTNNSVYRPANSGTEVARQINNSTLLRPTRPGATALRPTRPGVVSPTINPALARALSGYVFKRYIIPPQSVQDVQNAVNTLLTSTDTTCNTLRTAFAPIFKNQRRPQQERAGRRTTEVKELILDALPEGGYLDSGAGDATVTKALADYYQFSPVYAVELKRTPLPEGITYLSPDNMVSTVEPGSLSLITSFVSLHHISGDADYLTTLFSQFYNFLQPGGYYVIREHDLPITQVTNREYVDLVHKFVDVETLGDCTDEIIHYRSQADWQQLITSVGFIPVEYKPYNDKNAVSQRLYYQSFMKSL